MKQLILLLVTVISLSSCSTDYTVTKTDIPIEVVELNEAGRFDTLYAVKTEDRTYLWKADGYQGSYPNEDIFVAALILGIIIGMTVVSWLWIICD